MAVARHGRGPLADLRAAGSQVHPVFMLPPLATSWFGSALAVEPSLVVGALHMTAIFAAVYTAHVKDGYVDFHVRGEDDDHPITAPGCRRLLVASSALFLACLGALWGLAGPGAALLTLPTWLIGYTHAPQLDTHPVGATAGYPLGIALSITGAYYAQAGALSPVALGFALVFLVLLSGVKVIDDAQDYGYDRSIAKRTVAVALGPRRARRVAYGLMAAGLLAVVALAAAGLFPPASVAAVLAFGVVAAFAARAGPELATMLLVRGAYVFLALLLVAVWFRPLAPYL